MDVVAARIFTTLYVYLGLIWLAVICTILWVTRRRKALLDGCAAGLL
jgi:hypothetical protein